MITTTDSSALGRGRGWAAGQARPHTWLCRHCDMVGDYHRERDSQLRRVESLDRRDEIDRLVTFKEWLRTYEWDTDPHRQDNDHAQTGTDRVGTDQAGDPRQYGGRERSGPDPDGDPVGTARRAVDAIPYPATDDAWSTSSVAPADGHTAAADSDTAGDGVGVDGAGWRWAS